VLPEVRGRPVNGRSRRCSDPGTGRGRSEQEIGWTVSSTGIECAVKDTREERCLHKCFCGRERWKHAKRTRVLSIHNAHEHIQWDEAYEHASRGMGRALTAFAEQACL